MQSVVILALVLVLAEAEPPAPSGFGGIGNSGFGQVAYTGASHRPSNFFAQSPPSNSYHSPSNSYGPPASSHGVTGSYGTATSSYSDGAQGFSYNTPSSSYGSPAGNQGGYGANGGHGGGYGQEEPMPYNFAYAVKDYYGNDYNREETSDGNVVNGQYKVLLPDGRTQTVRYTADWQNGFNAQVTYEGEAKFPEPNRGGYGNSVGSTYGAPPASNYGTPSQYGAPSQGGNYFPTPLQSYGSPHSSPSSNYGSPAPSSGSSGTGKGYYAASPPQSYGPTTAGEGYKNHGPAPSHFTPSPQYSTPSNTYGPVNPIGILAQQSTFETQATSYTPLPPAQQYNPQGEESIGKLDHGNPYSGDTQSYVSPPTQTGKAYGARISQRNNQGYGKK